MNLHGRDRTGVKTAWVQAGARQALHWECLPGESAPSREISRLSSDSRRPWLSGTCKNDSFMWLKLILIPMKTGTPQILILAPIE